MASITVQSSDRTIAWRETEVSSKKKPVISTQDLAKRARRHMLRDSAGTGTLYKAALWTTLQHLDELSPEHLNGLPSHIQMDVMKTAKTIPQFLHFRHWKLFRLLDEPEVKDIVHKWQGITDGLRMSQRVALLSTPANNIQAWLVDLSLIGVAMLPGEIMDLRNLPNLAILRVQGDASDPGTHLISNSTMRNMARLALEGYGFANLQAMVLRTLPGFTTASLSYLNAFPMMTVFQCTDLGRGLKNLNFGYAGPDYFRRLSDGWLHSCGPFDKATVSRQGDGLDSNRHNWLKLFEHNWLEQGSDTSTPKLQTPSGKPPTFNSTTHQMLSYSVGSEATMKLGSVSYLVCAEGGHMHDAKTWEAVGLRAPGTVDEARKPKRAPTLKRKHNQDETLQDMLSLLS